MSREAAKRQQGMPSLDLIDEAVQLLRARPALLFPYYLGTVPFLIALTYFWTDMSTGADAYVRCETSALRMGLLFFWMKGWHSVFASNVRDALTGRVPQWNRRRLLRAFFIQAPIQSTALWVMPVAVVALLPLAWVYAFYQNALLEPRGEEGSVASVSRQAWRQAQLWPMQNHMMFSILFLFGLFVFLNVAIIILFVPQLLNMFFGIETEFSLSLYGFLNTTFLQTACAATFLCFDPLVKVCYVVRCYYGDSIQTADDLLGALRRLPPVSKRMAAAALLCGLLLTGSPARGQSSDPAPEPISSAQLDQSIRKVIERPTYNWRAPREKAPAELAEQRGFFVQFIHSVVSTLRGWLRWTFEEIGIFFRWIGKVFSRDRSTSPDRQSGSDMQSLQIMLYSMIVIVVAISLFLIFRIMRRRPPVVAVATSPAAATIPDLNAEEVNPTDLRVEEWMNLARSLLEKGELRLALRAMYLAGLAVLAGRDYIRAAGHKTNLDYRRELEKRTRSRPELASLFADQVTQFERVWYGLHEVRGEGIESFQRDYERLRELATK